MTLTTKNSKQVIERERDPARQLSQWRQETTQRHQLIGICRCESRSGDLFTMLRCLYAAEVNTHAHTQRETEIGRRYSVGSCAYFFCLAETVGGHPRETISFFSFYVSFLLLFLVSGLICAWLAHKSMLSGSLRGYLASCVCVAFVRLSQFNHI